MSKKPSRNLKLGPPHGHTPDQPPEAWGRARRAALRAISPIESFLRIQASSGIVLLVVALAAMIWANSPWRESYHHLWHTDLYLGVGPWELRQSLHWIINDGLMVIFFFVVGLEIRRELHDGELSELRRAALPAAAALGGMVVPAGIYLAFNVLGQGAPEGWGAPMATDIAFAVGVLAVLGKRIPAALRVLLLALAIIDDIGAIMVIAIFYSGGVKLLGLAIAAGGILIIMAFQRVGLRSPVTYIPAGLVVWTGMVVSGIHPTIAGVIIGLVTPVRSWFGKTGFVQAARATLDEIAEHADEDEEAIVPKLERLGAVRREAVPPATRLNIVLHPWVAFGVMPLFALANAGVTVGEVSFGDPRGTMVLAGIVLGLFLGKPLGIAAFGMGAVKLGIAELPRGVDGRGVWVVGLVGGIGFTMSLFIGGLAFEPGSDTLGMAKLAILLGSTLAGITGLLVGRFLLPAAPSEEAARTAHEAEASTEL